MIVSFACMTRDVKPISNSPCSTPNKPAAVARLDAHLGLTTQPPKKVNSQKKIFMYNNYILKDPEDRFSYAKFQKIKLLVLPRVS